MFKKIQKYLLYLLIIMLCGCSNSSSNNEIKNHRDNTPHIYENESPKEITIGNDLVTIDLTPSFEVITIFFRTSLFPEN